MLDTGQASDLLLETIDRIEAQSNKIGVFEIVLEFGKRYGFEYVTIGQLIHPSLQDIDYADLGVSNYPAEFQQKYMKENFLLHDPVISHALVAQDAFAWAGLIDGATKRGRTVFEESKAFGMPEGLTVPIHLQDRTPGLVSYAGQGRDLTPADIEILELIAVHSYSRLLDIYEANKKDKRIKLTPREVDVLHYVACGKTDMEIGQLLNLGHHSVKDHLANARKKMGAANRAHCVLIAIRDGHIIL